LLLLLLLLLLMLMLGAADADADAWKLLCCWIVAAIGGDWRSSVQK